MPVIDVWAVLADSDIPTGVGQRLLTRQRARHEGLTPDAVPEADKPFLARHMVAECGAVSEHGDVCVRSEEHPGMCESVGRKRVSSPGQAGKPWRWYRDASAPPVSVAPGEPPVTP